LKKPNPWLEKIKQRARELKRDVTALWFAYKDKRTPWYAKVFAIVVVAYAVSPIDLIPDFIPVIGYLDDLILIPLGITLALKMIPAEVMADARKQADNHLLTNKSIGWVAAAIVIIIWVVILASIGVAIWKAVAHKSQP
jgi:uncharacterized membrane protein YkvA (DUF1232 family)